MTAATSAPAGNKPDDQAGGQPDDQPGGRTDDRPLAKGDPFDRDVLPRRVPPALCCAPCSPR